MADLTFYYGTMNSGKTIELLKDAHNLEEKGYKVVVIKSLVDSKGEDKIVSRIGIERKVDILLPLNASLYDYAPVIKDAASILVDEAQFLTSNQVEELWKITKLIDIPVNCYGLRTDFTTHLFEGSKRLLALSDVFVPLKTRCNCKANANFNARKINGEFVVDGDKILIDGLSDNVIYEPLCGLDYIEKVLKLKKESLNKPFNIEK